MEIQAALANYRSLEDYFAPDYEQNNEVLDDFKRKYQDLTAEQTKELVDILINSQDIIDKFFVADLLYLYPRFDQSLLEPMLQTAIEYKDPSFNRIFLRPCLTAFGLETVADLLTDKFYKADIVGRIGISKLIYWMGATENLQQAILAQANVTQNLIELYFYKLCFRDKIKDSQNLPDHAAGLVKAIAGNKEYEDLLFNKLGWVIPNGTRN